VNFNENLLMTYKVLLQTTELEKSYQEFISLFRFVRVELEKEMPDYKFQGSIIENGMDYSYFQFSNEHLKNKGLKIAVVFVHRSFQFEVWVSGYNRKYQNQYYDIIKNKECVFELCNNPNRNDYILKLPLSKEIDLSDGESVVNQIKTASLKLVEFIKV